MKHRARVFSLVLGLSAFLLISDASAQFGGAGGGLGGGRGRGGDTQGGGRGSRSERPVTPPDFNTNEQIEYRLSLLQDDLKLRNEQNGAWQSFAAKTRAYIGDLGRDSARGMLPSYSAAAQASGLQHIAQAVDAAQNRLTALQDLETSARDLYQTLTPEQKMLADMRIPTIIAPRRQVGSVGNNSANSLPELGATPLPQR